MSEPRLPTHEEMTRALESHAAGDFDLSVKLAETQHALDTERTRVAVLEGALQRIAEADEMVRRYGAGNTAQRLGTLLTATFKARAALAVLPVDRVGVEPLDVDVLLRAMYARLPYHGNWTVAARETAEAIAAEYAHLIESPTEGET